ncbi:CRISPR/Cas system CMR-associated protein Cmr5 small subunit [Evansella vedderi]|uniref:CRISPR/Cas system CMR-associated protein Cmr5 small subunit n=1 Tax=Evansella vedderi TaxID=38282 RepID=A0ABU0A1W8_9BACI|nr:DUF3732 domain-containing protein [Evansella vedderi]MDQ0257094.1 CRISPR/Cas system CMR-associated protein Cmr5 small subunit [Evansella vedderi]
MKRWNIKKIILYSHHGEKSEVTFELETVNIITGDSQTGKSAIPEIIDYVMGASQCHIPSYVRSCLSWVGILWVKGSTQFSFYRKIPKPGYKSSQEVHFDIGSNIKIPENASYLSKKTNLEGGLAHFERLIGIGNVNSESFGKSTISRRITLRNTMPYLLQDDDVIISKNTLLRGANEPDKKISIIESIPYFFGVVDEKTLEAELEYQKIRKLVERLEKKLIIESSIVNGGASKALGLVQEAAQLGLCDAPENSVSNAELESILNKVQNWDFTQNTEVVEDKLPELYKLLAEEHARIVELKNKIRTAQNKMEAVNDFDKTVQKQKRKLEIVNVFKNPSDPNSCPLCDSNLTRVVAPIKTIKQLVNNVNNDLKEVERDRPKLDKYIQSLKNDVEKSEIQVEDYKLQIETLVKENEHAHNKFSILQRRYKTIGRISLYMESIENNINENGLKEKETLANLKEKLNKLEDEVNLLEKKEALDNIERRISLTATSIIKDLPFEKRYEDSPVYINLKNLNVGVSLSTHSESMRDVGSDENYLSLHVSLLLAMHRHFAKVNSPVPGVLLFDQLSRPYFPPDKEPGEVELDNERTSLLQFFELLFKEVDRQESLQVIVLEHAYFKNHDKYKSSVRYRWKKGENGLIPNGWPEK